MSPDISAEGLLRERGLRVTPQRQALLTLFLTHGGAHWSADQVRAQVLPGMPGLARGTTYKVLDELVRARILEELPDASGVSLYGLRLAPHHHFICAQCGRWYDIEVEGVGDLKLSGIPDDAVVHDIAVAFRGICHECQHRA